MTAIGVVERGLRGAALLLGLLLVLFGGCHSRIPQEERDWYAIAGPAAIPGIGVAGGIGRIFDRTEHSDWAVEAEGTYEFLDDADFLDDGFGGSGDTYIVRVGVKRFLSPGHEHAFFFGAGLAWVDAQGGSTDHTLILDPPGEYYGGYGQIGFLTRLSDRWSAGPDFRLFVLGGHGVEFMPEFTWQFVFRF